MKLLNSAKDAMHCDLEAQRRISKLAIMVMARWLIGRCASRPRSQLGRVKVSWWDRYQAAPSCVLQPHLPWLSNTKRHLACWL